ncbi:hypothetical protein N0A02_18165 [Paraburkholderia acidicola]|uniref:Uncharacterized protein n=1 Tax=Paraburkholderia acidicola TaxID=1912599 RepID=A0ABV1LPV4_9BURK
MTGDDPAEALQEGLRTSGNDSRFIFGRGVVGLIGVRMFMTGFDGRGVV